MYTSFEVEIRRGESINATLLASSVDGQYGGESGVIRIHTQGIEGVCDPTDFEATPARWIWAIPRNDTPLMPEGEFWMRVRVEVVGFGMVTKILKVVTVQ